MMDKANENMVFGLDIGTRSIVGTVGYLEDTGHFVVLAQEIKEHTTRSVIDGQIHDIAAVAKTIGEIKEKLEKTVGFPLKHVCIAAAGRVLKTKRVKTEYHFPVETKVMEEHIHSLDMLGVEQAHREVQEETADSDKHFYCVGYSVVTYYLNGYSISNVELHKANFIGVDLIATFLPDEVVDGLYSAVGEAGLEVANLTLEPIAAIDVAIPKEYRLLNIALVDVGAGTSDISIVKDDSIIAFGMMPLAGDEMTEAIAKKYLIDFQTAEKVKRQAGKKKQVSFKNIMGESMKLPSEDIMKVTEKTSREITKVVAEKIIELNGGHDVSAVFIVGGGGKMEGFPEFMAEYLGLPEGRVAVRGAEVLKKVDFMQEGIKKDSTLVTPIGICLNYYNRKSNFIHVLVNNATVKLYDTSKLTIMDASVQGGISSEELFPRRGASLHFTVNGEEREIRGGLGEAAEIILNGESANLNYEIKDKDVIKIKKATQGKRGKLQLTELPEAKQEIQITYCGTPMICPVLVKANGNMVSSFYEVQEKDELEIQKTYSLEQLYEFIGEQKEKKVSRNGHVLELSDVISEGEVLEEPFVPEEEPASTEVIPENVDNSQDEWKKEIPTYVPKKEKKQGVYVTINGTVTKLNDKPNHIFVDVFDVYPFDLSLAAGRQLITQVNGVECDFTKPIADGDKIDMIWKE